MSYPGKVQNGVIVLDNGAKLPDGTPVRVEPVEKSKPLPTEEKSLADALLEFAGVADDLPPDLARNHDHYLHGHPKK